MPLYEFVCRACRHPFEDLVLAGETPACPACASADLEKQFSVFASKGAGSARQVGYDSPEVARACGSCGDPRGPGSCATD